MRRDTETYGDIFYNREAIMRERGEKLEREERERKDFIKEENAET